MASNPWDSGDLSLDIQRWWVDPTQHVWLDTGDIYRPSTLLGYYNGVSVPKVEALGYWDGAGFLPLQPPS